MTGRMFSCERCEVPMNELDFKQLGLDPKENEGREIMRSVVIDAKVIPLLKETEDKCDRHDVVTDCT